MVLYGMVFQPYSQYPVRARAYVRSRLSLVTFPTGKTKVLMESPTLYLSTPNKHVLKSWSITGSQYMGEPDEYC